MQARRHSLGVFAEDTRAFYDDLVHTRLPTSSSFKNNRGQHRNLVFVRCLCPAHELVKIVQRKSVENLRSERHLTAMQVMLAQDQTQRFNGQKITAAGIAQNMSPPTGSFDSVASPASHRRTTSRVYDNTVSMIERRCEAGITIAARHNFRIWPNISANERK